MGVGRKPKPTALRLVGGNAGKRKINKSEPKPELAQPMPPAFLIDDAKVEWGRVCGSLYKVGLMTELDRGALAACCQAYGRWAEAERELALMNLTVTTSNGNAIQNPLVGIANKAAADYVKYAVEFGMTPSARARVTASTNDKQEDKYQEFFG